MSVSLVVEGFRPPDDEWRKMKAVWDACEAAGIDPPQEVADFFDGVEPDPAGITVDLEPRLRDWHGESANGYELTVADIPENVTVIRFYVSY